MQGLRRAPWLLMGLSGPHDAYILTKYFAAVVESLLEFFFVFSSHIQNYSDLC